MTNKYFFPLSDRIQHTSTHKKVIWKHQLKSKQSENTLNTERSSIDEIAVEQIWISLTRQAVLLKDVHQVIELTVNISTNGELSIIGNFDVDQ